ncbi:MAG: alpha-ketoacid dehydrogenase subunit beta [Nitriliruptoraceae bacterium]
MAERTMIEALNLALHQEMAADDTVLVLGEDVAQTGGVFRVTAGLKDEFGPTRVFDAPLAESAIVGTSIGLAVGGCRPVCELQFSGFASFAMHQLESHAARLRWRSRGRFEVPMVARMPYGAGVKALEHHSESKEVFYAHVPGLKMVVPSGPRVARGLLVSAIRDPDPVIFFEPKAIYRSLKEEVPDEEETVPIGVSRIVREGGDVTLIAYGAMLPRTVQAAEQLAEDGIEAEVVDLLTLSPLDDRTFTESVRRTGRAVIVHEAHRSFGPAGEVAFRLLERSFWWLQAPIRRVTGYDVTVPYFAREQAYLPDADRIERAARAALREE